MREILFRGKTGAGNWVYGSLILAGRYCCILETEENVHPLDYPYLDPDLGVIDGQATPVLLETVGQFTGITDKNGNKIFEGDILEEKSLYSLRTRTVVIGNAMTSFVYSTLEEWLEDWSTPIDDYEFGIDLSCYEIIGNVHDDPELLRWRKHA